METVKMILALVGGIAMFLFGMSVMGDALEKSAGNKLKSLLGNLTRNPVSGFILGAGVTAIIQSSSATTVMLVGFVNSGLMTLSGAIPVIMGANVGTTITSWILSLTGIEGDFFLLEIVKPSFFTPILAVIGAVLYIFLKNPKRRDIGLILLGFAVLIFGMEMMSDAVAPLAENETFAGLFLAFEHPLLGVLIGAVVTGIIQSSSASVGILQALSATGVVSYGAAIPIVMGQNIGTCFTALIASAGTNKNARRVAAVHLFFNITGTAVMLLLFTLVKALLGLDSLVATPIDEAGIAIVHTAFNFSCTLILLPFARLLEKLACLVVRDGKDGDATALFDERLIATPPIAIARARAVSCDMADLTHESVGDALTLLTAYDRKTVDKIIADESRVDEYEDAIGSYLMRLARESLNEDDSAEITRSLHVIGDLERISDHARNLAESAVEMNEKKLAFSEEARRGLYLLSDAVAEILELAVGAYTKSDLSLAEQVEPLEEVIDRLTDEIKLGHIERLQKDECTIELGFVLSDLLTNLERIADHCSNISGCVIELSAGDMDLHGYTKRVKLDNEVYDKLLEMYSVKYSLAK